MLKPTLMLPSDLSRQPLGQPAGNPLDFPATVPTHSPTKRQRPANRWLPARTWAGLCLLALGGQAACGGAVEFDLAQNVPEERIAGSATGGALTTILPTPVVFALDIAQVAVAHNARGPVNAVMLTGMQLQTSMGGTTTGSTSTFDFVQTINVYVESTRTNSSLARTLVAVQASAPGKTTSLNLSPQPGFNMLPYVTEGARFTSSATGTLPSQDVTFTGTFSVHVKTL